MRLSCVTHSTTHEGRFAQRDEVDFDWRRQLTGLPFRARQAAVVKDIERDGGKAIAIQADATDAEAGKAAVEKTVATFGKLDVLVNNAGTAIPKTFEETTLEEMDRVLDIKVRGVFIATQAALKHMKSGGPSI